MENLLCVGRRESQIQTVQSHLLLAMREDSEIGSSLCRTKQQVSGVTVGGKIRLGIALIEFTWTIELASAG